MNIVQTIKTKVLGQGKETKTETTDKELLEGEGVTNA